MNKIIFLLIGLTIFLFGCQNFVTPTGISCSSKAKELVPTEITLLRNDMTDFWTVESVIPIGGPTPLHWKDDTESMSQVRFRNGNVQGQNINFYYSDYPFIYKKQIIDSSGNILGDRGFNAYLTLKPIENSSRREGKTWFLNFMTFEVVDVNIQNCQWISEPSKETQQNDKLNAIPDSYELIWKDLKIGDSAVEFHRISFPNGWAPLNPFIGSKELKLRRFKNDLFVIHVFFDKEAYRQENGTVFSATDAVIVGKSLYWNSTIMRHEP